MSVRMAIRNLTQAASTGARPASGSQTSSPTPTQVPAQTATTDQVTLSSEAQTSNNTHAQVAIQAGDNLEGILRAHGYSVSEIYQPDAEGKSLVERVASSNNLRNPNLIIEGNSLSIPRKAEEPATDESPETTENSENTITVTADENVVDMMRLQDNIPLISGLRGGLFSRRGRTEDVITDKDINALGSIYRSGATSSLNLAGEDGDFSAVRDELRERGFNYADKYTNDMEYLYNGLPSDMSHQDRLQRVEDLARSAYRFDNTSPYQGQIETMGMYGRRSFQAGIDAALGYSEAEQQD